MGKNLEQWLAAKVKFRLSDKHITMARELGLNPKKFGSLDNHDQEPWKAPLPEFIERIYLKRFKREVPLEIVSIESKIKNDKARSAKKKSEKKKKRRQQVSNNQLKKDELPQAAWTSFKLN